MAAAEGIPSVGSSRARFTTPLFPHHEHFGSGFFSSAFFRFGSFTLAPKCNAARGTLTILSGGVKFLIAEPRTGLVMFRACNILRIDVNTNSSSILLLSSLAKSSLNNTTTKHWLSGERALESPNIAASLLNSSDPRGRYGASSCV